MRVWSSLVMVGIVVASVGASTPAPVDAREQPRLAVPDRPIRWLAAGDSYSSGEGLSDVSEPTCQRADRSGVHTSAAWAEVAREDLLPRELPLEPGVGPDGGFDFVACTGSVTQDLFDDNSGNNKKQWDPEDNGRFDLVTFSFGGNNIGFDSILQQCIGWSLSGLGAAIAGGARGGVVGGVQSWLNLVGCPAEEDIRREIAGLASGGNDYKDEHLPALPEFYRRVARDVVTPGGNVVVVGYPAFVEDPQFWPDDNHRMGHCQGIRERDALMLRGVAGLLNQTIGQAVEEANNNPQGVHFTFVDVNTGSPDAGIPHGDQRLFEPNVGPRHNLCGDDPWLNGVATGFTTGTVRKERSFHPTQDGHDREGSLIADVIRRLSWADLGPSQDAGLPVGWRPVGDTTFTPGAEAGSGTITSKVIWAGGLINEATAGCDYRVEADARMVEILAPGRVESGFGIVARAVLSGSAVSDGHGLQYESTLGRLRDVDYKQPDAAPIKAVVTDDDWHHIEIEVSGGTYRSEVDGEVVFSGTTSTACGGAPWLRVWQAAVEIRGLTVTVVSAPTPVPTTVPAPEAGDPVPIEAWTAVGGTTVTPSADGGFVLQAASLYWSGARAVAPSCNYRFSGEARAIAGHGYGFVARTEFDAAGAAVNGHGVQYDPEAGGYRDVEFPEVEQAPTTAAPTDDAWHRVAIEITGDQYRSFIDGVLVYSGTTDAPCGELYLRVWRGSAEMRNLRVQAL